MTSQISEVADLIRGVTYKSAESTKSAKPGFLPILRATNISRTLNFDDLVYVPQERVSHTQLLQPGDIVLAASSGSSRVVGKAALLHQEFEGSFGAFCYALRPSSQILPKYLSYFLQTSEYRNQVSVLAAGTNINNLKRNDLLGIELPVPPVPEQQAIVDEFETQFARLDDAESALRRVELRLENLHQAILVSELTSHADQRLGKMMEFFDVYVGSTPRRSREDYWGGDIPWVSSGEVQFGEIKDTKEKITDQGLSNSSTKVHPEGTVLLAMIGEGKTRGQAAILRTPAAHNQNSAAIRVSETPHSPEYVYFHLMSVYEETRRLGSGNNQKALSKSRVQNMPISLPHPVVQRAAVIRIETKLEQLRHIKKTFEDSRRRIIHLRQGILKNAFEGNRGQ